MPQATTSDWTDSAQNGRQGCRPRQCPRLLYPWLWVWTWPTVVLSMLKRSRLRQVKPGAKRRSLEAKSRGEFAFKRKDFRVEVDEYMQAIDFDWNDTMLLLNRSLCWLRAGLMSVPSTKA